MLTKVKLIILPIIYCYSGLVCAYDLALGSYNVPAKNNSLSIKDTKESSFLKNSATFSAIQNDKTIFKTEYQEKPDDWKKNSNGEVDKLSAWAINLDMPLQGDSLKLHGEFNSGQFNSYRNSYLSTNRSQQNSQQILEQNNDFNGLINVGVNGKIKDYQYGFSYQSVGEDYTKFNKKSKNLKTDKAGFKYNLGKRINDFNFEIAYLNTWDNINLNPDAMQYTDNAVKISSTYTISSWPYSAITLSYNFGDRKSSYVPQKKKYYDGTVNGVAASYDISYTNFNISLGSSVEFLQNDLISQEKSQSLSHYISASYSPHSTIYITPSIGYSTYLNKRANLNYQYDSLDLSVSLSYIPQKSPFKLSYFISHSNYKANDSYTDNSAMYNTLSLEWAIRKINNKKQSVLRLDVEQSSYSDNIYLNSNYNDIFVGLNWVYALR